MFVGCLKKEKKQGKCNLLFGQSYHRNRWLAIASKKQERRRVAYLNSDSPGEQSSTAPEPGFS